MSTRLSTRILARSAFVALWALAPLALVRTASAEPIHRTPSSASPAVAGEYGGPGLALLASKILTSVYDGPAAVDRGVILIRDGRIEAVGARSSIEIPADYQRVDLGELWIAPGLVDLHNHTAGSIRDLNDMVFLTNPGLRASSSVTPNNDLQQRAIAGGVTSVLLIPGSGTNMGGQGVLLRTAGDGYEDIEIRNPGSLKLALAGNPERWTINPGRTFMNWNTRNTF
jgi:imidazolonepropionase-like amidohydrolase